MADATGIKLMDTIQGTSFLAIQSAMPIFQLQNRELARYRVELVREDASELVIFVWKDGRTDTQRDVAVRLGTEVEQRARDVPVHGLDRARLTVLDTIQGSNVLVIQAAMQVFQRQYSADLRQYKIEVVREKDSVVVIFADKDREVGTRGNISKRPGFEIELDPRDLRVLRSNFIR